MCMLYYYGDGPISAWYGAWCPNLCSRPLVKLHARENIPVIADWGLYRELCGAHWGEDGEVLSDRREAQTGRHTAIKSRGEQAQ